MTVLSVSYYVLGAGASAAGKTPSRRASNPGSSVVPADESRVRVFPGVLDSRAYLTEGGTPTKSGAGDAGGARYLLHDDPMNRTQSSIGDDSGSECVPQVTQSSPDEQLNLVTRR
jgi:hypothetical protein